MPKKTDVEPKKKPQVRQKAINGILGFSLYCTPDEQGRMRSIADVAKKLGVAPGALGKLALKNEWVRKRDQITEIAMIQTQETIGEKLAKVNEAHFKAFSEMASFGMEILQAERKVYRKMAKGEKMDWRKDHMFSVGRAAVAHDMVVDGIKGQRVSLGLPTEVTRTAPTNVPEASALSHDDMEKMQTFLEVNHNQKLLK